MTRMVFCKKYQEELEGLANPPIPGEKGLEIYENYSKKAWEEWTDHQTRLINEKHLNMIDKEARSEEHTSELQSRPHLVCRLLLEKKKKNNKYNIRCTIQRK